MRFETADVGPRHRSPRPGEQTAAILERAGYDGDAIKAMFSKNIVA